MRARTHYLFLPRNHSHTHRARETVVAARLRGVADLILTLKDIARVAHGAPLAVLDRIVRHHCELLIALVDAAFGILNQFLHLHLHVIVCTDIDRAIELLRLPPQPLAVFMLWIILRLVAQRPPVISDTIPIILAPSSVYTLVEFVQDWVADAKCAHPFGLLTAARRAVIVAHLLCILVKDVNISWCRRTAAAFITLRQRQSPLLKPEEHSAVVRRHRRKALVEALHLRQRGPRLPRQPCLRAGSECEVAQKFLLR